MIIVHFAPKLFSLMGDISHSYLGWFVREVQHISIRNFCPNGDPLAHLPSPRLEIRIPSSAVVSCSSPQSLPASPRRSPSIKGKGNEFMQGDMIAETCNASWPMNKLRKRDIALKFISECQTSSSNSVTPNSITLTIEEEGEKEENEGEGIVVGEGEGEGGVGVKKVAMRRSSELLDLIYVKNLEVNVYDGSSDDIVESQIIDFSHLVSLGKLAIDHFEELPFNAIFFETDRELFVLDSLYTQMKGSALINFEGIDVEELHPGGKLDDKRERNELLSVHREKEELITSLSKKREELQKCYASQDRGGFGGPEATLKKFSELNLLKFLDNLGKQAESLELLLEAEERLESECEEQIMAISTNMASTSIPRCEELWETIDEINKTSSTTKSECLRTEFMLEARRLKLLAELQAVYPIDRLPSDEFAVRGLEVPVDVSSSTLSDEKLSTALGYIAHLVLLTAKFMGLTLRYSPLVQGSRSMMCDSANNNTSTGILPLFRRGAEKDKFDRAVMWLERDVQQILKSSGATYSSKAGMLENLHSFFRNEIFPRDMQI